MGKIAPQELLEAEDWTSAMARLRENVGRQLATTLIRALYNKDLQKRWRAAEALGIVVAQMAQVDAESAREIMRRLLWSLNEDSGSIGWGAPEAMAEVLRQSPQMRQEFLAVFMGHLEPPRWQRMDPWIRIGFLWGLWRLGKEACGTDAVLQITPILIKSLNDGQPPEKAWAFLAGKALGLLEETHSWGQVLICESTFPFYISGKVISKPTGDILKGLPSTAPPAKTPFPSQGSPLG